MSSADTNHTNAEDDQPVAMAHTHEIEFNRINYLVWVLHESARSFSLAIHTLELARRDPELAMAWVGMDVLSWNKTIAYHVCNYTHRRSYISQQTMYMKFCNVYQVADYAYLKKQLKWSYLFLRNVAATVLLFLRYKLECSSYSGLYGFDGKENNPESWKYGVAIKYKFNFKNEYPIICGHCEKSNGVCGYNGPYNSFSCKCPSGFNTAIDCYDGQWQSWSRGFRLLPWQIVTALACLLGLMLV